MDNNSKDSLDVKTKPRYCTTANCHNCHYYSTVSTFQLPREKYRYPVSHGEKNSFTSKHPVVKLRAMHMILIEK